MRQKLSAVLITKDEENNIKRCLSSITFADEIVVVDSGSTDNTVKICNEFGCIVLSADWMGFGPTKKYAVDNATYDWILSVDADEVVSESLKEEISRLLEAPPDKAFGIKRKSYYLGKQINYCGWDNDYPLRLFNRKYGNFNDKPVHESVVVNCDRDRIDSPLYHYTYPTIKSHIYKINKYSELSSGELIKENKRYSVVSSILFGINKFLKMYILKRGFLDGKAGLILCINSAFGVYLKYIKTWKTR